MWHNRISANFFLLLSIFYLLAEMSIENQSSGALQFQSIKEIHTDFRRPNVINYKLCSLNSHICHKKEGVSFTFEYFDEKWCLLFRSSHLLCFRYRICVVQILWRLLSIAQPRRKLWYGRKVSNKPNKHTLTHGKSRLERNLLEICFRSSNPTHIGHSVNNPVDSFIILML